MKDSLKLFDKAKAFMTRNRGSQDNIGLLGTYKLEHWRQGKLLNTFSGKNIIMNAAKNSLLDVYFHDAAQIAQNSWFMGLVSDSGWSAFNAADTMASHVGWTEFTGYTEASRPVWDPDVPASQAITNGTPVVFTINASGTVKGLFITSNNTKGGSSGLLWNGVLFQTGDVGVVSSDVLRATYTVNA